MTPSQHLEFLQELFDLSYDLKPEVFLKEFRSQVKHQLDKAELSHIENLPNQSISVNKL